ncbi:hypothetical protein HK099_003975 [Clydaea vesicula]|uniref:C2H2-type domain-containing protein n=1 Tax=Clydaea vesicula TaxID=447962 RepID=A0AAD5U9Y7_9FUNG|nr:hypothetical protein HK099_003975 [Clydaea vesicula]
MSVDNFNSTSNSNQHLFTCLTCHVAFKDSDIQRDHYKTDWHRYNLKRKVAELDPVNEEQFNLRLASQLNQKTESKISFECQPCKKQFSSQQSLENHFISKKHKESLKKFNPDAIDEEKKPVSASVLAKRENLAENQQWRQQLREAKTEEEVQDLIDIKVQQSVKLEETDCLFCPHQSQNFKANLEHMTVSHSFFIPDLEFLVDLNGLFSHLAEKISVGNICLYCNGKGKGFHTLESVRKHMTDKGHCKIFYQDGAEQEFYDYYVFEESDSEGAEWEDEDDEVNDSSSVVTANTTRIRSKDLAEHIANSANSTELILPSGRKAGHRTYAKYWSQKLKPDITNEAILINQLAGQYKSIGYFNQNQVSMVERRQRKLQGQITNKKALSLQTRLGVKANKFQKHFRPQVVF